jgi:2-polyprenyl-3-methyl-5-hydroxy-6-metoxy-1,4-benzoquinol methylase
MKNYGIKENYINNPKIEYDNTKHYWTKKRIEASKHFQFHVYSELNEIIDFSKKSKLIDLGCGTGLKLNIIKDTNNNLEVFGVDSAESVFHSRRYYKKGKFIVDDLSDCDYSLYENHKNSFDYIICSDVIEHLEDPDRLLDLIKYLSHENTIIILSTPDRIKFRGINNKQPNNKDHIREWSKDELLMYLNSRNFSIIKHKHSLPVKLSFSKIFFDEIFKRVIVFKKILYNQIVMMRIGK